MFWKSSFRFRVVALINISLVMSTTFEFPNFHAIFVVTAFMEVFLPLCEIVKSLLDSV